MIEDDGPLSADRVIRLARQMCLGLGHAHSLGLVHRDFKPDNVLVVDHDGAELARIVDFGLAISRDVDADVRLTAAGISVGTPIYAAPEQTAGDPNVDHRADLFSLGVSLYEMLAGTPPFDGNVIELIHHNAMGDPPPMALRGRVEVAPALEQLVRRLMSPAPPDRYATAAAVIEALDQISTPVPVPASLSTPVGSYRSQSTPLLVAPRRRTFAGLIASVVGLVVIAATVMGMRSLASTAVPTASTTSATTEIAELPAPVPPTTPSHRVASAFLPALPPAVSKPDPVAGPSAHPARPRGGARPVPPAVRAPANRGSAALPERASALPETASTPTRSRCWRSASGSA